MATAKSSYIKAGLGIILIIILMGIINTMSKKADVEHYDQYKAKIDNNKSLNPFTEEQKDTAIVPFVGFWQYDRPPKDTVPGFSDRIEVKRNAIIWRVTTWKFLTPSGDTSYFMHALTAYMKPFASKKNNPKHLTFDTHIIRQTFIGKDTCYGLARVDTTWEMLRTPEGIRVKDANYIPYDTTDLSHFFPDGSIKLVDALTINACRSNPLTANLREIAFIPSKSLPAEKEAK